MSQTTVARKKVFARRSLRSTKHICKGRPSGLCAMLALAYTAQVRSSLTPFTCFVSHVHSSLMTCSQCPRTPTYGIRHPHHFFYGALTHAALGSPAGSLATGFFAHSICFYLASSAKLPTPYYFTHPGKKAFDAMPAVRSLSNPVKISTFL